MVSWDKSTVIRATAWGMVLLVINLSLLRLPATTTQIPDGDKLIHLITYMLLCYWFLHAYWQKPYWILWGLILLGTTLECLQSFTSYRQFEWLDLLMNITGVVVAHLLFNYIHLKINFLLVLKTK